MHPYIPKQKDKLNQLIKIAKRHLGELEDWVHIEKRDSQMKSIYFLNETIDQLQSKITGQR